MPDAYDFWADRISADEKAAVAQFWQRFVEISDDLDRHWTTGVSDINPIEAKADALGSLSDRGIYWEYGPGEKGHHLALSPELNHDARPLARALVSAAPDMARWTFSDFRPPNDVDHNTIALIAGRAQMDVPLTGVTLRAGEHHRIDFTDQGQADESTLAGFAGLTFSVIFGEAIERDWLGDVHGDWSGRLLSFLKTRPDPVTWLTAFAEDAHDVLEDLMNSRPETPRASVFGPEAAHTLFNIEPYG